MHLSFGLRGSWAVWTATGNKEEYEVIFFFNSRYSIVCILWSKMIDTESRQGPSNELAAAAALVTQCSARYLSSFL